MFRVACGVELRLADTLVDVAQEGEHRADEEATVDVVVDAAEVRAAVEALAADAAEVVAEAVVRTQKVYHVYSVANVLPCRRLRWW